MGSRKFYLFIMIVLVLLLGFMTFEVLQPFFLPLAWAVVLSILFFPMYDFLLRHVKLRSIASLITVLFICSLILGPFSYVAYAFIDEMRSISSSFQLTNKLAQHPYLQWIYDKIIRVFGVPEAQFDKAIIENLGHVRDFVLEKATSGFGDVVLFFVNFLLMVFAIFFMLIDGPRFLQKGKNYMPFSEDQKQRLGNQIHDIVVSTIYGGVIVGLVQGLITGVAFAVLDFKSPVLWGFATAIASFIPLLGAFAIWGPAVVFLFAKGMTYKAIALLLIGVFGISLIDNVLKPLIIGNRVKMPMLIILFSVLGGIKVFGLIGLILGPLVIALFVSVLEIFRTFESETSSTPE
ncbi:MAG TPA: AI-2E family transporter [Dissulfurispiraceae bacterium]|nr:AI-2E family transporter [Dissulfurispiraceae bacterium]